MHVKREGVRKVHEMERHEFESILEAKLNPLQIQMDKLETNYEKVVELLTAQARQEEGIKNIKEDVSLLFNRVRECEKESSNKLWDMLKLGVAVLLTGIVGAIIGKKI